MQTPLLNNRGQGSFGAISEAASHTEYCPLLSAASFSNVAESVEKAEIWEVGVPFFSASELEKTPSPQEREKDLEAERAL